MSWENILKNDDIQNMFNMIEEHWPEHTKFAIAWKEDEFRIAPNLKGERTYITMGDTFEDGEKVSRPVERSPIWIKSESKILPITNPQEFINKMKQMGASVKGNRMSNIIFIKFEFITEA